MNFPPFTNLTTEHLFLRELRPNDAEEIFRLRKDETVNEFVDRPRAVTIDDAHKFIAMILELSEKYKSVNWALSRIGDPKLIGTAVYYNIEPENDKAEIGYELLPEYHGKGLMTEALQKIIAYGFEEMNLKTIIAEPKAGNLKSINLLKKLGFIKSGETINGYLVYELRA